MAFARSVRHLAVRYLPGLGLVTAVTAGAYGLSLVVPTVSPLLWSVFLGMAVAAARPISAQLWPGVSLASRQILRIGVALLGLRVAAGQLLEVGMPGLFVAAAVVPTVVLATVWIGRRLGVRPGLSLLIGTGTAICGASAIGAVAAVAESEKEDIGYAVATVTLFGTLAVVTLPLLEHAVLHLSLAAYAVWAGASVHEVAQVLAAAAPAGGAAVKVATVVKLIRVALLAPSLLALSLARRRGSGAALKRPVPLFVVAFLGCVALASLGLVPSALQALAGGVDTILLASALAGLGLGVRLTEVARLGWHPVLVGFGAWLVAGLTALAGVVLLVR